MSNKPILSPKSQQAQKELLSFDDYEGSEFDDASVCGDQTAKASKKKNVFPIPLNDTTTTDTTKGLPSKRTFSEAQSKSAGEIMSFHYRSMDAYSRHKKLVNDYLLYYGGGKSLQEAFKRDTSKDKTDLDVIREEIKFVWDDDDEPTTWEKRLAKKYYDKLFKEYCICDLSLYKFNKVAMRWRIEKEVIDGKGQFICGEKKCPLKDGLRTWEVNFAYNEHGVKKNALVKLRLCPECSWKLNYHHKKKEVTKPEKKEKEKSKPKDKSKKTDEKDSDTEDVEEVVKKIKKEKEDGTPKTSKSDENKKESVQEDNMIILNDDSVWKKPDQKLEEKTREEEFEDYLEDLLL